MKLVCGMIAESSLVEAFWSDPDWMRVGGMRTPSHADPPTVMLVTPESVSDPVVEFGSVLSEDTVITPSIASPDPEEIVDPVSTVDPVLVEGPLRLIGILWVGAVTVFCWSSTSVCANALPFSTAPVWSMMLVALRIVPLKVE